MKGLKPRIKDVLESVIDEMVSKGIYWTEALSQFEKMFILRVLEQTNGNLGRAARTMGIHRNTLSRKIREHEVNTSKKTKSTKKKAEKKR